MKRLCTHFFFVVLLVAFSVASWGENPTDRPITKNESVSLRDYFDTRIAALDKAVEVANKSNERRLELLNEFKAAMLDQSNKYLTIAEFKATINNMNDRITTLVSYKDQSEGKASQTQVFITMGIALISCFLAGISIIIQFIKIRGKDK